MALGALGIGLSADAAETTATRTDGRVVIRVDGSLFAEYRTDQAAKPIVWPILGPTGKPMTRAYPMEKVAGEKEDHVHQKSMWFTHGNVNDVDFWAEGKGKGKIVHRDFVRVSSSPAVVESVNDWMGPDGRRVCADKRTLTFIVEGSTRIIDWDITVQATDGPVTFGDTKEGMFGIRIPTVMDVNSNQGGRIITSEGLENESAWGKPAAWVDYQGVVDGDAVGIAVLNHPSSFRHPTTWHVRSYGLFAANPFGLSDFTGDKTVNGSYTLPAGKEVRFSYRVLFHLGDEKSARIAEAYSNFAAEKRPP
jgi:hypothetical protein